MTMVLVLTAFTGSSVGLIDRSIKHLVHEAGYSVVGKYSSTVVHSKHRRQNKESKNVASDFLELEAADHINAMTGTGDERIDDGLTW
jgi:hypothetical protein